MSIVINYWGKKEVVVIRLIGGVVKSSALVTWLVVFGLYNCI